ncbi:MAG: efflux RND transporter permease subunit [Hyphomonadaceae bacterium]|nr:efflux RND transporter permease subunit [Hyphomonadaceae bacterium]
MPDWTAEEIIFGILYMALGTFRAAGAVFAAVPLALAGGVYTLFLRGMPFSISAAAGFICLAGVAVLNGLVVMTSINRRLDLGMPIDEAIRVGMIEKFRAVLMTGIVPAIGFVPVAIAHGTGAEVQKPLATVVIGGLITATLLTLFVLPAICRLMLKSGHQLREGEMPSPAHRAQPRRRPNNPPASAPAATRRRGSTQGCEENRDTANGYHHNRRSRTADRSSSPRTCGAHATHSRSTLFARR